MDAYSTCLLKIYCNNNAPNFNIRELLAEIEEAIDTQDYEIVCLSNQDSFTIAEPGEDEPFATFIRFSFPRRLSQLEQIEQEAKLQLAKACGVEVLQNSTRYRLIRLKKLIVV